MPARRTDRSRLTALLLALPLAALADAPLVSETADVIDTGKCQVEAAAGRATASGEPAARGFDLLGSCGVLQQGQAALGYTRERAAGQTAERLSSFLKWTLVAPAPGRTGWGLRAQAAADRWPGRNWRGEEIEVLGLATREVAGGVLLHANLGHAYSREARAGRTVWSLGIETAADTTFAADLCGDDRSRPGVSAGIGRRFGGGLSANLVLGASFEEPRTRWIALGGKLEF